MFTKIVEYPNKIILLSLVSIVLINSFISLTPILDRGFDGDDTKVLTFYNILEFKGFSLLERIYLIWTKEITRLYNNQYLYIGILYDLFGYNFKVYQVVGILLKVITTLTLYPLILILFKNRFLAFASTLFYSIIPSSAGGLTFVITSVDYLGVIFMSLFGITYYNLITKGKGFLVASLLLLFTISFSYIRVFPLFVVIFLVESLILLRGIYEHRLNKSTLLSFVPIKRVIFFVLPSNYFF